ncbi:MAG: hybrid-cluster NAD(P)-dependent oxidoreductase [Gammaproteobacteria bacterium]|nr:MAG: hybrid-cluster NAD(P)-dependent oxidoreductase [Gammaproteobacteria bacterium]
MSIRELSQLQNAISWNTRKTPVTCINVIQETHDVKTFQFQADDAQLFHFKPGQFIGLNLEIEGQKHNRSYTIASSPTRPHILEVTIKKEAGGAVSPWLHENIEVGSSIEVRGPAGRFNNLDTPSKKVLLISAGSGITPMMSMSRFWTDLQPNKDIVFLNWVRGVEDIIFRREIALLDSRNKNFKPEIICTQPGLSENWLGKRGRINKTTLNDMVPDLAERTIFCCGPEGFMEAVKSCLQVLDFDMANYHDESFDPGGKKKKVSLAKAELSKINLLEPTKREFPPIYSLKLKKSKLELEVKPNDILLDVLESANVDIGSSCRGGNCGACHVVKLSGKTHTRTEDGLTDEYRQQGHILTCTTKLLSDVELDI